MVWLIHSHEPSSCKYTLNVIHDCRCIVANFRDSKEIMMTSDSEAEYKYSSSYNIPIKTALPTICPAGELRCVNGNCITISQLCDKVPTHSYSCNSYDFLFIRSLSVLLSFGLDRAQVTDCPDGADEAMCVYRNWAKYSYKSVVWLEKENFIIGWDIFANNHSRVYSTYEFTFLCFQVSYDWFFKWLFFFAMKFFAKFYVLQQKMINFYFVFYFV